jgi:hypothetical protein
MDTTTRRRRHRRGDRRDDQIELQVVTPGAGGATRTTSSSIVEHRPAILGLGRWLDRRIGLLFDIDRHPAQLGTDYTVRRVVDFPLAGALAALATISAERRAAPATRHGAAAVVRTAETWLAFAFPDRASAVGGLRLDGELHVHRFGPPVPVEVIVEPWSGDRTELRLQMRTRHGRLRLPRRYFDAAHPVMGALRDEIEARAAA